MAKPPQNTTPSVTLNPQQIMQTTQNLKNRFAQLKGQSDQLVADGMTELVNGMLQLISNCLQSNNEKDAKIRALEQELDKRNPATKKLQADPEGLAQGR